jgi:PPOX class probable F420-dependent enzyme
MRNLPPSLAANPPENRSVFCALASIGIPRHTSASSLCERTQTLKAAIMKPLFQSNYILLSTKKRDGSFVATPVWCAGNEKVLYAYSAGDAGKVKRLRNFNECKIAACTVLGKRLSEDQSATAYLLNAEESDIAYRTLLKKYGLQMRLLNLGASITGRKTSRAFIRIALS